MMESTRNDMRNDMRGMPPPDQVPPASPQNFSRPSQTIGPLIGIIIVIAVLVIGGIYFWSQRKEKLQREEERKAAEETSLREGAVDRLGGTVGAPESTSDEVGAIQADLLATDIDNLDADLRNAESEL